MNSARIAVLLPCLNEEATIAAVVAAFQRALPDAHIHVCDNGSDDGTAEAARAAGATVVAEPRRGKGRAIRRLFREVDADIYLMADGDGTYDARSAGHLVSTLQEHDLDMLVAARERADAHAYTPLRRLGNRLFTALARWRCGPGVHDLLSGYRAFSRRFVERFPAHSDGFEIETELTLFAASSDLAWDEIECPYFARPEGSASKLKAFRDGFRILHTLLFSPPPGSLETSTVGSHSVPATAGAARPTRPRLGALRGAALIGAVTLAATIVFLALNGLAVRADPEPVVEALRVSYEHPERTLEDSAERFNDCLLSLMALDRGASTWERTVSPRRVYRYTRPQRPCDALEQRLDQGAVDDSDFLTVFYHQYWAGQRVMLQWLLPWTGVNGLRSLLEALTFVLLGIGLAGALVLAGAVVTAPHPWDREPRDRKLPARVRRALGLPTAEDEATSRLLKRQTLFQPTAYAVLFVCLLLFLDLGDRAGSFTTGASNVLTLSLLLAVPVLRIASWKPEHQVLLFGGFGALIAYHELLFGSALIGLVVLLLALATAPLPSTVHDVQRSQHLGDPRTWRRRLLIRGGAAYVGCLSAVFLLRVVLAELVFSEPVLFKFWDQLTHRLYGAARSSIHPEIDPFYAGRPTVERFLDRLENNLGTVGLGSQVLALVLIGLTAVTLIAATLYVLRHWWTLEDPWRWAGILAAGWSVPAWYAIFFAHTMAHVPVMIRLLALPYAAATILIAGTAVFGRRSVAA
ncbi:MAG: glycosyltransferase [Acidobacteria bacterium]|nr:glycosyltransferase [Acidobacteriota bacterium]